MLAETKYVPRYDDDIQPHCKQRVCECKCRHSACALCHHCTTLRGPTSIKTRHTFHSNNQTTLSALANCDTLSIPALLLKLWVAHCNKQFLNFLCFDLQISTQAKWLRIRPGNRPQTVAFATILVLELPCLGCLPSHRPPIRDPSRNFCH